MALVNKEMAGGRSFGRSFWACCAAVGVESPAGGKVGGCAEPAGREEDVGALHDRPARQGLLSHFTTRSLGSLTAWQMLAADIQQEMQAAAASIRRASQARSSQHGRGSQHVRPSLVADDAHDAAPRKALGRCKEEDEYQLISEIGRGAFGAAWKARRRVDQSLVCIKRIGHTDRQMVRACIEAGRL